LKTFIFAVLLSFILIAKPTKAVVVFIVDEVELGSFTEFTIGARDDLTPMFFGHFAESSDLNIKITDSSSANFYMLYRNTLFTFEGRGNCSAIKMYKKDSTEIAAISKETGSQRVSTMDIFENIVVNNSSWPEKGKISEGRIVLEYVPGAAPGRKVQMIFASSFFTSLNPEYNSKIAKAATESVERIEYIEPEISYPFDK
jgi:hypothetical protein